MNDLRRELAPVSSQAWEAIDAEAKRTLTLMLTARKLVDFTGPLGWEASAVSAGRVDALPDAPVQGVQTRLRRVQALLEVRAPFELARGELEAVGRGAKAPDLDALREAARRIAMIENRAVLDGYAQAGILGMTQAAAGRALRVSDEYAAYPGTVAEAIDNLHGAGVGGPYAIALGSRCYTGLTRTTKGGYPVIEHVRKLLDGAIIWTPALDGALVVTLRGGDFELVVGQDCSIGYLGHTEAAVSLYVQESFTFRVLSPEAAIPLVFAGA